MYSPSFERQFSYLMQSGAYTPEQRGEFAGATESLPGMRLQQRPGDEMVTAKCQQVIGAFQNFGRLALDGRGCLLVVAVIEQTVAVIVRRLGLE